jgi:hypothetical protein
MGSRIILVSAVIALPRPPCGLAGETVKSRTCYEDGFLPGYLKKPFDENPPPRRIFGGGVFSIRLFAVARTLRPGNFEFRNKKKVGTKSPGKPHRCQEGGRNRREFLDSLFCNTATSEKRRSCPTGNQMSSDL